MKWKPFKHDGNEYDLSHLHPTILTLAQPAKGDVEAKEHQFDVVFSHHCFSKENKPHHDPLLEYSDNRELRTGADPDN